ncbi:HpcH/HpaI aldolase family protein [Paraburkholderia sp. ZP32-5]|uniref:HpcH/HpaI aldolase family protein n=1 Tax=Paraburkholderia sp. ZP32-5 TaxID=2883245 RepID=UPI001F204EC1|nr:aldolase/citrate lyase family protein [Paraburkholderia sp. ZP32-5]
MTRTRETKPSFIGEMRAGRQQIGLRSQLCSPIAAEALGFSGCDYVYIDMEHSPNDLMSVQQQAQAIAGTPAHVLVRLPKLDSLLIQQLLDFGIENIVVPMVETVEEAQLAVAATRYPPHGVRSVAKIHRGNQYAGGNEYFDEIDSRVCLIVMIETRAALSRIEEIAAVDGVHGVLIGPADLAADLGHARASGHADVLAAITGAIPKIKAAGAFAGMSAAEGAAGRKWLDMGCQFVSVAGDIQMLASRARAMVEEASA